jgi:uncharacterized protein (DUF58 family)
MLTKQDDSAEAILDKRKLQTLGVLLPIRLSALSFFSGRHPLGRAGEGMRFLRTRPFESGEDNPRDIDKFSPPGQVWINEWEAEAQASVLVYADVSASMSFAPKVALRNLALLQLTYSLWRATDRVRTVLFSADSRETIAQRNLKGQLERLMQRLSVPGILPGQDAVEVLCAQATQARKIRDDLVFMVSDFCPVADEKAADNVETWRSAKRAIACDIVPVIISFELSTDLYGSIRLWDAERRQHRLTLLTPARIERINAAEAERVAGLERLFRQLGMDHLVLRHENDVYPGLETLARWRRRRRN